MPAVEPASSFFVGNAPQGANYAAPLVNFQQLADLPNEYFQGTQQARTLALQNAFPNGLPRLPNGQIDTNGMMDTLTRLGGAEAAQSIMANLMRQEAAQTAGNMLLPGGDASSANAPAAPVAPSVSGPAAPIPGGPNAGPGNITGGRPQAQPQLSSVGTDNKGSDSIRTLATGLFPNQDVSRLINYYSQRNGVSPDATLNPQQAQAFTTWASQVKAAAGKRQQGAQPQPQTSPSDNEDPSSSGQPSSGTSAQDRQINGVNAAPPVTGGTSGAPGPVPGPSPQRPPVGQPGQPGPTSAAAAIMPGASPEMQRVQELRTQAQRRQAAGAYLDALYGAGSGKGYLDQADALNKQADQIAEALRTGSQLTEQQKNVLDPRVQQAEIAKGVEQKRQEGLVAAGQKQYEGIQANARSYETQQKGWLDTARALFSQPELYTGVGSNMSQFVNRVKAAFANDPKGAEYQAVLGKVNAANILNTINQQKFDMLETGSNAGRIFAGQIDQAEKTSPGVENTLEANRALVELQTRIGKMNSEFGRQAREYLRTHPYLDAAFDEQLSKWIEKNPLLSPAEISNPSLLGVPYVPPDRNSPEKVVAWARAMGLKEGDPIRTANGRLGAVPRIRVPVPVQAGPQGMPPANAATP